jgi:hypothetical protein
MRILIAVGTFTATVLIGMFIEWGYDLSSWPMLSRFFVVLIAAVASALFIEIYNHNGRRRMK